jgi:hypothetical protein
MSQRRFRFDYRLIRRVGFAICLSVLSILRSTPDGGGGDQGSRIVAMPSEPPRRIYLVKDVARGEFAVTDWAQVSGAWNRNSTYEDMLKLTRTVKTPPSLFETESGPYKILFVLHTHSKMASTTLRRACWENLRATCNVVSLRRDPMGYSNPSDLAALIDKCEDTNHYCVEGWRYHAQNFPTNSTSYRPLSIAFVHLFPFRKFDDWTASAIKQIYAAHSEAGCNIVAKRLDTCGGWLELDFAKYSKQNMARMLEIKDSPGGQSHVHLFFLYDYSLVQPTLDRLSLSYQVPMLQYLDMQYKQIRQSGTCPGQTIEKFHECFDDQLLQV